MPSVRRPLRFRHACALLAAALLTACGGGGGSVDAPGGAAAADDGPDSAPNAVVTATPTTLRDATRLAHQASFGPSEALTADIAARGPKAWIASQIALNTSRYTTGGSGAVHQWTGSNGYCDGKVSTCWRDNFSSQPSLWDFYRNAIEQPDQLRQRVAFALSQIAVISNLELEGTYGFRYYHNTLLDHAFVSYRQVLKKVALSPMMGAYLNNANNDKAAPNENFARELLQLFALGTCELNADGSLKGGACTPTYNNETVRNYAYALTGWTYPVGGKSAWGCWPQGTNCAYFDGDMLPAPTLHDTQERALLAGVKVPAGSTPEQALERVLDSLMAHPNMAPFISRQLIQRLVSSNPSAAYVQRVATAFNAGSFQGIGSGQRGDLSATVAAILLDVAARGTTSARQFGKLREPVLMFTGVLRALNGRSDGGALSWWWGDALRQHVLRAPSVFNFYPPDYPLPGQPALSAPEFGIHNANTALERLNFLNYVLWWGGSSPDSSMPNPLGTKVNLTAFQSDAGDVGRLVDRLSLLAYGQPLAATTRTAVIKAVEGPWAVGSQDWQRSRVAQAAYLVFAAPNYQIQR
jgi:hypothetical protein